MGLNEPITSGKGQEQLWKIQWRTLINVQLQSKLKQDVRMHKYWEEEEYKIIIMAII